MINELLNDGFDKPREEQKKDFEEIISSYANKNCKCCMGLGYSGWSEDYKRYVACTCVLDNLEKAVDEMKVSDAEKGGILQKLRTRFGLN